MLLKDKLLISLNVDKEPYIKELTKDNIINLTGQSGSGKSFFLKSLITNEWANNTRVIICDPEAEYITLTKNLSGNVIDVGNAKEGRINPFHIYKILTEDELRTALQAREVSLAETRKRHEDRATTTATTTATATATAFPIH